MNYKLETSCGNDFSTVAMKAKEIAIGRKVLVEFEFNEVFCLVDHNTNTELLLRDYHNSWTMGWKTVGPYCVEKYSPEVQEELNHKTKLAEEKRAAQEAEWKAKDAKERQEFEQQVSGIELDLSDPAAWKTSRANNSDGYGSAALDYAEGWAKKMQIEISKGKTVAECAEETQQGLGFLGITGFQYGCAVNILTHTWKHGEELRVWHNGKYKHTGDGVVNPAVLTIKG